MSELNKKLLIILDVMKENTERDGQILYLVEKIIKFLVQDEYNKEFNTIGNLTVILKGLLKDYPIEIRNHIKSILI